MIRLLTAAESRQAERLAAFHGIPSLAQMEAAAAKTCVIICQLPGLRLGDRESSRPPSILVLAGRGNNGGDGIALARHLRATGRQVSLALCGGDDGLPAEAAANLGAWRAAGGRTANARTDPAFWDDLSSELAAGPQVVVDALLGVGQTCPPAGGVARAVELVSKVRSRLGAEHPLVVALDVPTGLDSDTGRAFAPCVQADLTVTYGLPKLGLFTLHGPALAGEVTLAGLGWPPGVPAAGVAGVAALVDASMLQATLRRRAVDTHKRDSGKVLIVAGSPGMTGAAALAGHGAIRGGAGLVTIAVGASQQPTVAASCLEALTMALPEMSPGEPAGQAAGAVLHAAASADVLALGPGLGRSPAAAALVREVTAAWPGCLVLDADGLQAYAGAAAGIAVRPAGAATIITPHAGELAQLLGCTAAEVQADRPAAARRAAALTSAVCLLKGSGTIVAEPAGNLWVVPAGNPGMATGGMGDVLTGLIAAVIAAAVRAGGQGPALGELVAAAAMIHSLAGDWAAAEGGMTGLRAGDVAERLPGVAAIARGEAGAPASLIKQLRGVAAFV